MKESIKVAIVQDTPPHFDLPACMKKVKQKMAEAAEHGAELVVFGETWLSGYPVWLDYCPKIGLWDHAPTKKVFARMYKNGVQVPGKEVVQLSKWAKKYQQVLVIGINEVVAKGIGNRSIYNAFLIFDSDGTLLNHHRKLMPTFTEKLLYATGDAVGLKSVKSAVGRIGALICWEHWMPLARMAMHESGELIHIALWPNVHEMLQIASRTYAFEGRCFVIAVGQTMQVKDVPAELELPDSLKGRVDKFLLKGASCIIGPDGKYLLQPQVKTQDNIYYELRELDRVYAESMSLDVTGHYNRTDVFDFAVNRVRKGND
ncbi:MAG: carbon-nitrogen hydrolase family protein [Bacteroidota bacterium]